MPNDAQSPAPQAVPGVVACKAILLDRDGTINVERADYVRTVDQLVLLPRAAEALHALGKFAVPVAVVTNQSALGRGIFDRAALDAIHARLSELCAAAGVNIAGYFVCPHKPDDGCACRKPQPGLILAAAATLHVQPHECILVGDSITDYQAARAAGCALVILVRSGRQGALLDEWVQEHAPHDAHLYIVDDLLAAMQLLAQGGMRMRAARAVAMPRQDAERNTDEDRQQAGMLLESVGLK